MAFSTRCPECRAKLRLDDAPDDGESIECPKCGSTFDPSASADEPVKKKKDKPKKEKPPAGPAGPKKRVIKKKKTNPVLLFGALGAALVFVIVLGIFLFIYLGKAGKVEEMLCYVPGDCNVVRGINTSQISKYPGFATEMDPYITGAVKNAALDLAGAIGYADGDDMLDYVVIGKNKKAAHNTGTVYVFRTRKAFPKPDPLAGSQLMRAADAGGTTYYNANGKGILNNAAVFTPTNRLVVVVPNGPMKSQMVNAIAAGGVKNKTTMFAGTAGDAGRRASAGNLWCVVRPDGALRSYAKDMGASVKGAFPGFNSACEKTTAMAWWTTYGGKGISFGGAIECPDSTASSELVRAMNDGELGKQDDAEIPNDMKKAVQGSGSKEFREFLAWLKFRRTGTAAYFTARMSPENGKRYSQVFHGTGVAGWSDDDNDGGGGGRGFGPPGGGR